MLHYSPFIPHTYAHLQEARVFPPGALPEAAYAQYVKKFAALEDVTVSRIAYESDGITVTGVAALPKVIAPGRHHLVIYNRGGSREYGKLTLINILHAMVPLARAGCLVFASNYRGADGGEGPAPGLAQGGGRESKDEFGGADVRDVLNLLRLARAHPAFDGKNACMAGHSRGGMMTWRALQEGASVTTAVGIAAMSDVRAQAEADPGTAQRVFDALIPNAAQNRQQAYDSRSALCWPEAIRIPTLLLHGEADDVISPQQSTALHQALIAQGTPCELVLYPGGTHALVRQFDDVVARILEWMEKWRVN